MKNLRLFIIGNSGLEQDWELFALMRPFNSYLNFFENHQRKQEELLSKESFTSLFYDFVKQTVMFHMVTSLIYGVTPILFSVIKGKTKTCAALFPSA